MSVVRFALVACVALVIGVIVNPVQTQAVSAPAQELHPVPLTMRASAERSLIYVVGYSHRHGIIFNDFSHGRVMAVRPDGSGLRVLLRHAQATQVAGGLIEYFRPSSSSDRMYYRDLDNRRHGIEPHKWMSITVGGGVRVARHRDGWHLYYDPDNARERDFGVMSDLPNVHPMYVNFGASDQGLLVVASFNSGRRSMTEFYPRPDKPQHHRLDTHGVPKSVDFVCNHVATAIGCVDRDSEQEVIGLRRGRMLRPFVRHVPGTVGDVVFAHGRETRHAYTTEDAVQSDEPTCPCTIHFDNGTVVKNLSWETAVSNYAANPSIFYVKDTRDGPAIYRSHFGRGREHLVVRAPRTALAASVPELGAGRALWKDNTTASDTMWSRRFTLHNGHPSLAPLHPLLHREVRQIRAWSLSGTRTAYEIVRMSGGELPEPLPGEIHLLAGATDRILGRGTLLGMSGLRVLYEKPSGRVIVYDLVTRTRYDATQQLGLTVTDSPPMLEGNYLTFFRSDGSLWRTDLSSAAAPVQIAGPVPGFASSFTFVDQSSPIFGSGDWVAWTEQSNGVDIGRYRNVRTGAAPHRVPALWTIVGASAAGMLVARQDRHFRIHFQVRRWSDGSVRSTLPGRTAPFEGKLPSLNGPVAGYVDSVTHRPMLARLPGHIDTRPRSFGNPRAATSVSHGDRWSLDLVSSAPLTACSVVITAGGARVHTVQCAASAMAVGEVRAAWRPTQPGAYKWRIVARNGDGRLLRADGTTGATDGALQVT